MPDTPARPVIGVRVHTADGLTHLHDLGRDWYRRHDGALDVTAPYGLLGLDADPGANATRTIAEYQPDVWHSVELVHGEPEPAAPTITVNVVDNPGPGVLRDYGRALVREIRDGIRDVEREDATPDPVEDLLYEAWGVIANAGGRNGGWDSEHPEWVAAAERWRERWRAHTGGTVRRARTAREVADERVTLAELAVEQARVGYASTFNVARQDVANAEQRLVDAHRLAAEVAAEEDAA